MEAVMKIEQIDGEQMVSTITVASELGVDHPSTIRVIGKYLSEIEQAFGRVRFEIQPLETNGGIQSSKIAYLTEDQAIFVSTLSRNSQQVVQFKARLVQAFQAARKFIQQATAPLSDAEMKLQVFRMLEQEAESLKETNRLLENTIKEQAPKVKYAEDALSATNCSTITSIAKEFGMGGETLNKILHDKGVQYLQGEQWLLYAKYQNKGYTQTRTSTYTGSDGTSRTSHLTVWSERGRAFIRLKMQEWFPEGFVKPKAAKKKKPSTLTVRYSL